MIHFDTADEATTIFSLLLMLLPKRGLCIL
jgi:hypothetical protein